MEFVNKNFEETVYRIDAFGAAVKFVDWTRNSVKIEVPHETIFERQQRNIEKIKSLMGANIFEL